jgi:hypothetical protein
MSISYSLSPVVCILSSLSHFSFLLLILFLDDQIFHCRIRLEKLYIKAPNTQDRILDIHSYIYKT